MAIDPQFIVSLKGKQFALWAGLLDAATKAGLVAVHVDLIQFPSPENGQLAISQATCTFADGRTFTEIGDCGPGNCTPMIAPHACRMSATRAKGRCLRDALNIGFAMFEELGPDTGDETPSRISHNDRTQRSGPSAAHRASPPPAAPPAPVLCSVDGCGVVLNADEQKASAKYWPDLGPVCKVHGKERITHALDDAPAAE